MSAFCKSVVALGYHSFKQKHGIVDRQYHAFCIFFYSLEKISLKVILGGKRMKDCLKIVSVKALEVLDSRGNPTVQVEVVTEGGFSRQINSSFRSIYRGF